MHLYTGAGDGKSLLLEDKYFQDTDLLLQFWLPLSLNSFLEGRILYSFLMFQFIILSAPKWIIVLLLVYYVRTYMDSIFPQCQNLLNNRFTRHIGFVGCNLPRAPEFPSWPAGCKFFYLNFKY